MERGNHMDIQDRINDLPDAERDRIVTLKRELTKRYGNVKVNFRFVGMLNGLLDKALSKDGRNAFYSWAFDRKITSSHELLVVEMFAVVVWAGPQKSAIDGEGWTYSKKCIADLQILIKLFAGGVGQPQLPLQTDWKDATPEERKARRDKIIHELGF